MTFFKSTLADHTHRDCAVSAASTSFHGEVKAIDSAVEEVLANIHLCSKNIHILSDCTSAIHIVTSAVTSDIHADLQAHTRDLNAQILDKDHFVDIMWIGGHIGLRGNDLADGYAKAAAMQAKHIDSVVHTTTSIKSKVRSELLRTWQRRWDLHSGTQTYAFIPKVSFTSTSTLCPSADTKRNRLILGHHRLKDRMHRIMPKAYASPTCPCRTAAQTSQHIMFHCSQLFSKERTMLMDTIEHALVKCYVPPFKRDITLKTLLCPAIQPDFNSIVQKAVAKFLFSIDLDIYPSDHSCHYVFLL